MQVLLFVWKPVTEVETCSPVGTSADPGLGGRGLELWTVQLSLCTEKKSTFHKSDAFIKVCTMLGQEQEGLACRHSYPTVVQVWQFDCGNWEIFFSPLFMLCFMHAKGHQENVPNTLWNVLLFWPLQFSTWTSFCRCHLFPIVMCNWRIKPQKERAICNTQEPGWCVSLTVFYACMRLKMLRDTLLELCLLRWPTLLMSFQAERDEVGTALWSHICVVVVGDPPRDPQLEGGLALWGVSPVGVAWQGCPTQGVSLAGGQPCGGGSSPGPPCPPIFVVQIMQFSGNFKGKTPILSKFWAQGPLWGQNSAAPWSKRSAPGTCSFLG